MTEKFVCRGDLILSGCLFAFECPPLSSGRAVHWQEVVKMSSRIPSFKVEKGE